MGVLFTMHKLYPRKPKKIVKKTKRNDFEFDFANKQKTDKKVKWKIPTNGDQIRSAGQPEYGAQCLPISKPPKSFLFFLMTAITTKTNVDEYTHWIWIKWKAIRITKYTFIHTKQKNKQNKLDHFWLTIMKRKTTWKNCKKKNIWDKQKNEKNQPN